MLSELALTFTDREQSLLTIRARPCTTFLVQHHGGGCHCPPSPSKAAGGRLRDSVPGQTFRENSMCGEGSDHVSVTSKGIPTPLESTMAWKDPHWCCLGWVHRHPWGAGSMADCTHFPICVKAERWNGKALSICITLTCALTLEQIEIVKDNNPLASQHKESSTQQSGGTNSKWEWPRGKA